jgi:hypothetical protein
VPTYSPFASVFDAVDVVVEPPGFAVVFVVAFGVFSIIDVVVGFSDALEFLLSEPQPLKRIATTAMPILSFVMAEP